VFRKQLEIAKKHNKPVIVHSRDAIQDTYDILSEYGLMGSIHCFSGSLEMAREFIKMGYLIGVGGVVTYKNAKNIINVIENINLEYILLETDSPYMTPEPFRKYKNDSSYIPVIAKKIAELKNVSVEEVGRVTSDSARRLFDF
jgi:TatD DNase family protein